MSRSEYNHMASGVPFPPELVDAVWQKAAVVPGVDPAVRRKDCCGAWIDRTRYGDHTPYGTGWEIDHKLPVDAGGTDELDNLQPLNWMNNRAKDDGPLACPVANEAW